MRPRGLALNLVQSWKTIRGRPRGFPRLRSRRPCALNAQSRVGEKIHSFPAPEPVGGRYRKARRRVQRLGGFSVGKTRYLGSRSICLRKDHITSRCRREDKIVVVVVVVPHAFVVYNVTRGSRSPPLPLPAIPPRHR